MFRNPRNRFTVALVLVAFLLGAIPAAAAAPSRSGGREGAFTWESLAARVLTWLGGVDRGLSGLWDKTSAAIDPLGGAAAPPQGAPAGPDYSAAIDPDG